MKCLISCFSLLVLLSKGVESANILMVFPMPSYSHFALGHRLAEGLLEKGHTVTMISSYKKPVNNANYTEVYMEGLKDLIEQEKNVFVEFEAMWPVNQIIACYPLGYLISEFTLKHPLVLNLVRERKGQFDVVILEQFLDESLAVISQQLDAPLIYLATLLTSIWNHHLVGNPASVSSVPNFFMDYKGRMDFKERLHNWFLYVSEELYRRLVAFPHHDKLLHEAFPDAPSLNDLLYKQDSLILANSHISTNDPIPHLPNIIEIGGFHLKTETLPNDLKKALDNAKNGVVLFGLGSNLKVSSLPLEKKQAILRTFAKFNQTFFWKWEEDSIEGKPDNVVLGKWFPQQAILAHPNVRAFISHGGLLSITEAITYGVPIIGVPFFGDQKMNVNTAALKGYAISVPYKELTEEKLTDALKNILFDPKYKKIAEEKMRLINDRPQPPLQEAVYWVEHVIRHKGTKHFRSKAMDLRWYEYEMIDVAIFLTFVVFAIIISAVYLIKCILCAFSSKKVEKKKVH